MENAFYLNKNTVERNNSALTQTIFSIIILIMMLFLTVSLQAQPFASGDGTKENPYIIENEVQLDSVRNYLSSHFQLANDIDLSSLANWEPIGNTNSRFTGSFDGNDFSIQNFTLNNPEANAQGLFGYFEPATAKDSIKNLKLQNVHVSARDSIGALAGKTFNATLYNCSVEGIIRGNQKFGGLAGAISGSIVKKCNGDVTMTGNGRIGGLVGWLASSTITQCYCLGTITTDATEIGGLAWNASNSGCHITECFTDMTLTGNNSIGGILYSGSSATVNNCYSASDIHGYGQCGGIVSGGYNLNIQHCYSTGAIYGHQSGGIGANNWGPSQVFKNCLVINAEISVPAETEYIGRVWGAPTTSLQSNFAWDNLHVSDSLITTGTQNNQNGENVSFAQITDSAFYKDAGIWNTPWDFASKWTMDTTNTSPFPILQALSPDIQNLKHSQAIIWNQNLSASVDDTLILSAHGIHFPIAYTSENEQIAQISRDTAFLIEQGQTTVQAHLPGNTFFEATSESYNLTVFAQGDGTRENPFTISNIDELNYVRDNLEAHYKLTADLDLINIENWYPIGGTCGDLECEYEYFTGSFDGNGHTISNLTINRPNESYIGLFGNFDPLMVNDSIKNLTLTNVNIRGEETIGAIVGSSKNGSIINCHVSGSIISYYDDAGGIVGSAYSTQIEDCTNQASVTTSEGYTGGIVGSHYSGSITNCQNSGDITGYGYTGGVAGYVSSSVVKLCSNSGYIQSTYTGTGGIVGAIYENVIVRNCYNTGDVSGIDEVGGIAGDAYKNCLITKCFSTGAIYGLEELGGIAGYAGLNTSINQCYSTSSIVPTSSSIELGGIVGYLSSSSISESYSTGTMRGIERLGGIAGYSSSSTIASSVAINAGIANSTNTTTETGRIAGVNSASTLTDNYSWDEMRTNGLLVETGTTDNIDGFNTPYDMLTSESFYTNTLIFTEQTWNFDTTWVMNQAISPYPILRGLASDEQKVKHAQSITWTQDIATPVGDTLILAATGGKTGSQITYSSLQPDVAHTYYDSLFVNTLGAARIMAYVAGSEFFAADSITKPLVNFENEGTEQDPYLIYTANELDAVRCNASAHYKLMNNIDLSSFQNWQPIGDNNQKFDGYFDGNNHTISNLNINRPSEYFIGLFASVNQGPTIGNDKNNTTTKNPKSTTGDIRNLYIVNANVVGKEYVGILAGSISDTDSIMNIHTSGTVTTQSYAAGGISGSTDNSTINMCSSAASLTAHSGTGGLTGYSNFSNIVNSYFNGAIHGQNYEIGGIAGSINNSAIENCFTSGTLCAPEQVGGIAGYSYKSTIKNSYSSADINVTEEDAGGIAGYINQSTITNCYSTGHIDATNSWNAGGILGKAYAWSTTTNTLKNNLSITAKINGKPDYSYRVIGNSYGNIIQTNNYAWKDMYANDNKITDGQHDNKNGQNVTIDAVKGEAFYTYAANWDAEAWDFTNTWEMNLSISPYPILKTIASDVQKVQHSQVITTPLPQALPTDATVEDSLTLTAVNDGPSEQVTYNSNDTLIATIMGDTLIAKGLGTTTINVFFPETEFYKQSNMLEHPYTVAHKANQTVEWNQVLNDMTYGEITIELTGTTSSGYPIEYSSSNEEVAVVNGNLLSITGVGATTITAYHSGNQGYNPSANEIERSFDVATLELTIGGSFTVANKHFDGTTDATIVDNNLVLETPVNGDNVSLNDITVAFTSPEIGNNLEVTLLSANLTGPDAYNYTLSLAGAPTTNANIIDGTSISNQNQNVNIYPNPFSNNINIETQDHTQYISISNTCGQTLFESNTNTNYINTSTFAPGVYIIKLKTTNNKTITKKLIKQ